MTHSLTLGSLLLTKSLPDVEHGFVFDVLADGASFGVAQSVQEIVRSLLADGDLVRTTRYGNREVSFKVEITGPTLQAVADGEAALRREVGRRNTLTWEAPDVFSVATVFEVVTSEMAQSFDDLDELRSRRIFTLTLACAPFARSQSMTMVDALSSGTSTVVIDTCDSVTGWAGFRNGVAFTASTSWEAGAVGIAELDNAITSPEIWKLARTGSVDFTTTPYLIVEVRTIASDFGPPLNLSAYADGVLLPRLDVTLIPGSVNYRVTFRVDATAPVTVLEFAHISTAGHPWQGLFIHNVSRTAVAPGVSTRQGSRILEIGGTERTPCSLELLSPASFLGNTIVHTTPEVGSGYAPSMRRWRVSGNTTSVNSGSRKISGTWEPLAPNPVISRTPATAMPEGGYVLMAAIKASSTGDHTVEWAVKSSTSGTALGEFSGTTQWKFLVANELTLVPLGVVSAPIVRSPHLDLEVHLLGTAALQVEEWWMFNIGDDSALTIVNTSEGAMYLDSPNVDRGVPEIWVGLANRELVFHPGTRLIAQGNHVLAPGAMQVTVISDSSDNTATSLSYYERWHSNAAR